MLLATPGQTTTYASCHASSVPINSSGSSGNSNNGSIITNHNAKPHKLGRATYKLIESSSSQNKISTSSSNSASTTGTNAPTVTATATQAALLMKSIAARSNRNSGFHTVTPGNNIKSNNGTVNVNDNGVSNYVRKPIATAINNTSKINSKSLTSAVPSSSAVNVKLSGVAATSSSAISSSLSASTKVILSASYIKNYTVPPTDLHRYSAARSRVFSVDSLYDEMCHFKPIRSVPTTPWKCGSKSRGVTIKAPKARMGQKASNCDVDLNTPPIRKNLKRDCSKAKAKIKPKLSANLFPHLKSQPSAFVRILLPTCNYVLPSSTQRTCERRKASKICETIKKQNNVETIKTSKKKIKSKAATKKRKVAPRVSNTKKKKAQTKPKKNKSTKSTTLTKSKKSNVENVNRKTPPLTRRRVKMNGNCKLYGPLA